MIVALGWHGITVFWWVGELIWRPTGFAPWLLVNAA
jgi:hypothetical protein